jgi:RNA polymerase sigma-70 factor, ECF subfamily
MARSGLLDPDSEESLMAAYVAGDRQAFARLFARVAPRVHAFFQRSFRDVSVADELMQITFLKVHRARETYRPDLPFRPWLFTVAGHVRRDEWRKRYRLAEDAGEDALIAADENNAVTRTRNQEETQDRRNEVRAAVEALPEIQRTILQLHRYEGLTFIEIAKMLETTPGAVRQHAFRAYETLRAQLSESAESAPEVRGKIA